jgi:glyoxylase-like metal-dependent hydrolase (beta-lactamase superfamily II)
MTAPERAPEDALARAERAGIHRLSLPTPFLVGRINCYLIEDEPLTLIDTGPNSGKALDQLELALAERGHRVEDLELIVITHQHMDHFGLLDILARRSGAEVAALDLLAPYLARFSESMDADDQFAESLMRLHGVPADVVSSLRTVSSAFRACGCSAQVTRRLHHGDELALRDRTLRVLHRPGHSPSDTLFFDERRAIMLAGDHLIAHISSNPLLSRPLEPISGAARPPEAAPGAARPPEAAPGAARPPEAISDAERPRALITYIDSMRATREMPIELTLPGHGDPFLDHRTLIDQRFAMHARRAQKMLGLIRDRPLSAYELAHAMWGNVAVTQAYLTLSEVLGHVDILVRDGLAQELSSGNVVRFGATAPAVGR